MRYEAVLHAVSAASFPPGHSLRLQASPESSAPLDWITYFTDYDSRTSPQLVCHIRGHAPTLDTAASALIHSGYRTLQLIAVAANSGILTPHTEFVYEPRPGGEFVAWEVLGQDVQTTWRGVDVERTRALVEAFNGHPKEARLVRAAEHYGESLKLAQPAGSIHTIMHLWIAAENLTHVAEHRLRSEHCLEDRESLGRKLGVAPRKGERYLRDQDVLSAIRQAEVFCGDTQTHKQLKSASDGIEHGYLTFGEARAEAGDVVDSAARRVRESILRESGLAQDDIDVLMEEPYRSRLPVWRPRVVTRGRLGDPTDFDFDARHVSIDFDVELVLDEIRPTESATNCRLTVDSYSPDGPPLQVASVGLSAPGTLLIDPALTKDVSVSEADDA